MIHEVRPWQGLSVGTVLPVVDSCMGRGRKNILESEENRNVEVGRKVRTAL